MKHFVHWNAYTTIMILGEVVMDAREHSLQNYPMQYVYEQTGNL